MGPYFHHRKVMFSAACYQFSKSVGKKTLHPTPSIDEKDNIKPFQLVVKSTKRKFIFFEKAHYHSTEFQLSELLMEKEPFTTEVVTEPLMSDYNRDTKLSLKGKFGAELCKEILDVDLETSDMVTINIKFGKVVKQEVKEPKLLEELSKSETLMEKFADIYLALPLETSEMQVEYKGMQLVFPLKTFEKFIRLDPKKVLCIITGVVQLPDGGEISRNTELDAKANVSTSVLPNTSANAEGDLKKDKDIVLAPNSAIAYNLREINVDKHNGAMQLVLAEHEHGGFKDSVGYDETDAVCGGTSDSAGAGAMNKLILDTDLQHPKEVFKSILDLPPSLRKELTSILLEMISASRDIEILNTNVIEKLERSKKIEVNVSMLEKVLLAPKNKWMKIIDLLGCTITSSGDIKAPAKVTDIVAALGELFDAITELDDEETELIRGCTPKTAPALLKVLQNGIRGEKNTGPEVNQITQDSNAQKLLLYLEYRISPGLIEAPVVLPASIDEVYWTVFALWGNQ